MTHEHNDQFPGDGKRGATYRGHGAGKRGGVRGIRGGRVLSAARVPGVSETEESRQTEPGNVAGAPQKRPVELGAARLVIDGKRGEARLLSEVWSEVRHQVKRERFRRSPVVFGLIVTALLLLLA